MIKRGVFMKRIFALFCVALLLFSFSVGAYAEIVVDEKWVADMLLDYVVGSGQTAGSPSASPEYQGINNGSVSFYISDTGKVNVTYTVIQRHNTKTEAVAEIYLERHIIGPFWDRLNIRWKDTFTEKYHVQSFSTDVNESGLYRVTVNVISGNDRFKKTASFEYKENISFGDANGDGRITAADARKILRYSAKLETYSLFIEERGDINRDGSVTAQDARLVLKVSSMNL